MQGTYPRLFVPIMGLILVIVLVRYHLIKQAEVQDATQHQQAQVQLTGHYLLPVLVSASAHGTQAEIQTLLDAEAAYNPGIQRMRWTDRGTSLHAGSPVSAPPQVPHWFSELAALTPQGGTFEQKLPDGALVQLEVVIGHGQVLGKFGAMSAPRCPFRH